MFISLLDGLGVIERWCLNFAGGVLDNQIGVQQLEEIGNVISLSKGYDTYWGYLNNGLDVTRAFGIALVTTYFLMYLYDSAIREQITIDALIKVLIQLVLVVSVINNFDTIINALLSFGESIFQMMRTKVVSGSTGSVESTDGSSLNGYQIVMDWYNNTHADGAKGDSAATILFQCLAFSIVSWISKVAVYFAIFSRLIELGWKIVFGPIGVSNMFEGGPNSGGIKYLKEVAALALAGAAVYVVCAIGFSVVGTMMSTSFQPDDPGNTSWLAAVGAEAATAGAAIGISNKIKNIFG